MRRTADETREHVLRTAQELFYGNGVRATGVDQVAAEAGIAPTTLYRLFPSKDHLVAAYVERADQETRGWFTEAVRSAPDHPRARILAVFDALLEQLRVPEVRGCACLFVLAEFPDGGLRAHGRAVAAKSWIREQLGVLTAELAARTAVQDPAGLADQLTLVFEGANATTSAHGVQGPARQARALAERLLPPDRPETPGR